MNELQLDTTEIAEIFRGSRLRHSWWQRHSVGGCCRWKVRACYWLAKFYIVAKTI